MGVRSEPLPEGALLASYRERGAFTDCFVTDVAGVVSISRFVAAFYTTPVFRLERWILAAALSLPSSDTGARQLAEGLIDTFSAWRVEARKGNQLLVADFKGRTRSWFMVSVTGTGPAARTRLYFGSAIVPVVDPASGRAAMSGGFRALAGFHKLYSKVLLRSAKARLQQLH